MGTVKRFNPTQIGRERLGTTETRGGGNMAKRTAKKAPIKGSRTSFRAIKRHAKARTAVEKAPTRSASAKAPTTLIGPEARRDERFRELVAWDMLQGLDEATARRHAHDEINDDLRKEQLFSPMPGQVFERAEPCHVMGGAVHTSARARWWHYLAPIDGVRGTN
jgi:hypothetical protein